MKKIGSILLLFGFLVLTAQEKKQLTLEDAVLGYYKGLYPKRLINLQWSENADEFVYRTDTSFVIKDARNRKIAEIGLADLRKSLPGLTLKRLPYLRGFGYGKLFFKVDTNVVFLPYKSMKAEVIPLNANAENIDADLRYNQVAFTMDNNLYVATKNKGIQAVTSEKNPDIVSGQAIARNEFGITKGTFWSPSGMQLAFYRKDETDVDEYPLVDITETPAKLKNIKYPMNGRGSEEPAVGVYSPSTGKTVYLQLFDKAGKYHYVTNLTWDSNEKFIYLAELNRDQNHLWFNQYDAATGRFVKTLFEEKNGKWVEPEHPAYFIPGSGDFIWMSERDGFMNLYRYNRNGRLIKKVTSNHWVIDDVLGFSKDGRYVYTVGTGVDPREKHLFRINLRTGMEKQLTSGHGTHRILLSPDGRYYIDVFSSIDNPGLTTLHSTARYKKSVTLLKSENPLKNYDVSKPEFFSIRGEFTDKLYGRIIKPSHFDPSKKYPVLVYVYGGPHVQLVQNRWLGGAPLWMYWLAEQGYIVFTLDGHGSDRRGFAFKSVIYRQLGQTEARDQMDGIAYLRTLPYVDINRLAVHGWSFGGFMTLTLLTEYPDIFNVGVAGGPVTDWKWYEVMYGERYMDTFKQNPEGFKKTSILNKIQNLKAKLMTIHGYMDDVVVPQHDIALHDKAIAEGIQMDFYLYPRAKHNVYGRRRVHLMKKILTYIMENNRKK